MNKKLSNDLLKKVMLVSGLVALANVDLNKKPTALPKERFESSLSVEETPKGLVVSIAIIVNIELRTKIVSYEVFSAIKSLLKKANIKINKINVYVRGVK